MISVCMATFEGEHFLREQLDSIRACLAEHDELIISDDGSRDATRDILADYAARDDRIILTDGPRTGVISNFSHAISLARGDYVFLTDQDDVWSPTKVERVMQEFTDDSVTLVVHNARIIDEYGNPTDETMFERRRSRAGLVKNLTMNSYVGCCMAFRASLIPAFMPIPPNCEMHDWWIGLVAELVSRPRFIGDELIGYRRHDHNTSPLTHYRPTKMVANRLTFIAELAARSRRLKGMRV